jgi:hypothetical protein
MHALGTYLRTSVLFFVRFRGFQIGQPAEPQRRQGGLLQRRFLQTSQVLRLHRQLRNCNHFFEQIFILVFGPFSSRRIF